MNNNIQIYISNNALYINYYYYYFKEGELSIGR